MTFRPAPPIPDPHLKVCGIRNTARQVRTGGRNAPESPSPGESLKALARRALEEAARVDLPGADSESLRKKPESPSEPAGISPESDLHAAILSAVALGGALSGRELELRAGRPEPVRFYDVLAELIEAGLLETDPQSCRYYLPEREL